MRLQDNFESGSEEKRGGSECEESYVGHGSDKQCTEGAALWGPSFFGGRNLFYAQ